MDFEDGLERAASPTSRWSQKQREREPSRQPRQTIEGGQERRGKHKDTRRNKGSALQLTSSSRRMNLGPNSAVERCETGACNHGQSRSKAEGGRRGPRTTVLHRSAMRKTRQAGCRRCKRLFRGQSPVAHYASIVQDGHGQLVQGWLCRQVSRRFASESNTS